MKLTSPSNQPDSDFSAKSGSDRAPEALDQEPDSLGQQAPPAEDATEHEPTASESLDDEPAPVEPAPTPAEPVPTPAAETAFSWSNISLDAFLVTLTFGAIAACALCLYQTLTSYHIPAPIVIERNEGAQLLERLKSLESKFYSADEQMSLKQRYAALKKDQATLSQQIHAAQKAREDTQTGIIAQQKAILKAYKDAKRLAKQQVSSGLHIGTIGTRDGRTFHNALIRRIVNKKLIISHSGGQSPVDVDRFIPGALPRLIRFALGLEEILDTKDLEINRADADPQAVHGTNHVSRVRHASLRLPAAAPIVDSKPIAPSQSAPIPTQAPAERWIAPTAPLNL